MKQDLLYTNYDKASGLLFIGDPHVASRHPGRRLESDEETILVTTDKLSQAIDISNKLNAVPVILGDLFNQAKDSKAWLITLVARALRKAIHKPLCLPGNHDLLATDVTDDTALAAIAECGLITLLPHANGPACTFLFDGVRVGLGGTVHGEAIPESVAGMFGDEIMAKVVWVTHHDIAFEGAYPGSVDPYPIEGCCLVVNGHMHRTKTPILCGDTHWTCPGNIYRQTITDADHVPAVWYWTPDMEIPCMEALRYIKGVFDWTGKNTVARAGDLIPEAHVAEQASTFVSELKASLGGEMPATYDGSVLKEDIETIKEKCQSPAAVREIIDMLHAAQLTDGAVQG
jgi:hypothetical protein